MSDGVTLVTGGNGGIGAYVVDYLLRAGHHNLIIQYRRSREHLDRVIGGHGLSTDVAFEADLSDEGSVDRLASAVADKGRHVQCLVNVAGSSTNGMAWKLHVEDVDRIVADNFRSTFLTCRAFVPGMRERGYGRIVNFSSIVASTGIAGASHYAAAKAAIVAYTRSLALEVAPRGITANSLALGYFDTGLIHSVPPSLQDDIRARIPVGRFGSRNDVGAAVEFLLSDHAGFITGQVLHLNGGQY